ncbi:MAG: NUDIX domain-containing protein, partial [Acidiferrobacteraceae bacterium]
YVAEVRSKKVSLPINPDLGHPEHHEFRWMTRAQARDALPERLLPIVDWAYETADAAGPLQSG